MERNETAIIEVFRKQYFQLNLNFTIIYDCLCHVVKVIEEVRLRRWGVKYKIVPLVFQNLDLTEKSISKYQYCKSVYTFLRVIFRIHSFQNNVILSNAVCKLKSNFWQLHQVRKAVFVVNIYVIKRERVYMRFRLMILSVYFQ